MRRVVTTSFQRIHVKTRAKGRSVAAIELGKAIDRRSGKLSSSEFIASYTMDRPLRINVRGPCISQRRTEVLASLNTGLTTMLFAYMRQSWTRLGNGVGCNCEKIIRRCGQRYGEKDKKMACRFVRCTLGRPCDAVRHVAEYCSKSFGTNVDGVGKSTHVWSVLLVIYQAGCGCQCTDHLCPDAT